MPRRESTLRSAQFSAALALRTGDDDGVYLRNAPLAGVRTRHDLIDLIVTTRTGDVYGTALSVGFAQRVLVDGLAERQRANPERRPRLTQQEATAILHDVHPGLAPPNPDERVLTLDTVLKHIHTARDAVQHYWETVAQGDPLCVAVHQGLHAVALDAQGIEINYQQHRRRLQRRI